VILTFRPIARWPDGWDRARPPSDRSPFSATYSNTLRLLDTELSMLGASHPTLQLDVTEREVRMDGQVRADARPGFPGVILAFDTRSLGTLTYSCARFGSGTAWDRETHRTTYRPGWQENLRAIALGLESLRRLERYGIANRGQQYAGWRELPSGIALGPAMTVEEAALYLAEHSGADWAEEVVADPSFALALFKDAVKLHHPDVGGDPATFRKLTEARDLLESTFGAQ
jgi:hypothetical protein